MIERVLILVSERQMALNNHLLYANALMRRGAAVSIGDVNSVHARHYVVQVDAAPLSGPLSPGDRVDGAACAPIPLAELDLVWMMSPPHPSLAQDVYQLLWMAQRQTRFVNTVEALLLLNNKNVLGALAAPENLIPTNADSRFGGLWKVFEESEHDWVLKPSNSGAGADVFLVRKGDSNARALLQSATGNETVHGVMMDPSLLGLHRRFCVLQRFEPGVRTSEKRVLIAGGQPFAQYRKVPAAGEHRGNLSVGGTIELCELSPDERAVCATLGEGLVRHGIRFAGVDLVYPYILEVNIFNPAGTRVLLRTTGTDVSDRGVELIFEHFERQTTAGADSPTEAGRR
jgi:glutathione synthase